MISTLFGRVDPAGGVCSLARSRERGSVLVSSVSVRFTEKQGPTMSDASASTGNRPNDPWVEVSGSPRLSAWLAEHHVSLAFTTYQTGKLFLLGHNTEGGLTVFERTFNRAMGLWADGQTIWLSTLFQLWRFENLLRPGELYKGHDRLFVPKVANTTGDLDIHDVAIAADGNPVFVATKFGCVAGLSIRASFTPCWRPAFLSKLAAEDRCHLNGMALAEGRPRYATAVSQSDVADGWRDCRQTGGVVLEIPTSRVLCSGLSMPHSPRLYQGRLWLHNSGAGQFGSIDPSGGPFQPLTFCPGYLRDLRS